MLSVHTMRVRLLLEPRPRSMASIMRGTGWMLHAASSSSPCAVLTLSCRCPFHSQHHLATLDLVIMEMLIKQAMCCAC